MKIGVLITVGMSTVEKWIQDFIEKLPEDQCGEVIKKKLKDEKGIEWSLENYRKVEELLRTWVLESPDKLRECSLWEKIKNDLKAKDEKISAEIDTFNDFVKRELSKLNDLELYIRFLTTKETKAIAERILKGKILKIAQNTRPDIKFIEIEGSVESEEEFNQILKKELPEKLEEFFIDESFDRRYLLISGGYKGLIPLITLLGMMFPGTYIVYRHEKGSENVIIYPLPILPDFSTLDSVRSLLKSGKLPESSDVKEELPFLKGFFENKELTSLGSFFRKFYENRTIYGKGEALLNKIHHKGLRDALEKQLKYWEYLWIGDQIPETVEHSRKHSLRLLEYASHITILYPEIIKELGDEGLFILYSSIWLHDFGHSATVFNSSSELFHCLKEEILKNLQKNGNNLVALNPNIIRKYHHIFTVNMLSSDFKFLLPNVDKDLIKGILLACLYHRKKMPIVEIQNENKIEGKPLVECLRKFFPENTNLQEKIKLAASLLSFIDGLDVQTDRVVSKEYEEMRIKRDIYEVNFHLAALKNLINKMCIEKTTRNLIDHLEKLNKLWKNGGDYLSLKKVLEDALHLENSVKEKFPDIVSGIKEIQVLGKSPIYHLHRILFIISQKEHFQKHKTVEFVYLDKESDGTLKINVVVNRNTENEESVYHEVKKDMEEEFTKVKPVLGKFIKGISVDKIEYEFE